MELTERQRQTLLLVIAILAMTCFFSSFVLFVCAVYIKIKVDARMKLIETYNSDALPGIFVFVGVVNLVQNLSCLFVCLQLRNIDNRVGLMRLLLPILIGGIILVIFEVSTAIASFAHIGILDAEFEAGLNKAMEEYVQGGELKVEMDTVQSEYLCCGDLDYTEWFTHSWLDPEYLRSSTGGAKKFFHTDGKYYSDDTPFSCCDMRSPRPCIHHHIHDNSRHHNYNYMVETTLYVQGCRGILMETYSRVLWTVAVIALLIATVKITALLLFRLIQTSLRKAQEEDDWKATTIAYIYYPKPEDLDLEKKLKDDDKEQARQKDDNANKNESYSDNETDDTADTDTESDLEKVKVKTEQNNNKNEQSASIGGNQTTPNTPSWHPISFTTSYQSTNDVSSKNINHSADRDDFVNQNLGTRQSQSYRNAGFVSDIDTKRETGFKNKYYNDNNIKCSRVQSNDSKIREIQTEGQHNRRMNLQRVPSVQTVTSRGGGDSRSNTWNATESLAQVKKYGMGIQMPSKQVRFCSQYSRLQDGQSHLASMFLPSSKSRNKPLTKYRTSADNYKYSLVHTNSCSEEDDEEEEEEEAYEANSKNEFDNCNNDNNNIDNNDSRFESEHEIIMKDVSEIVPIKYDTSKVEIHKVRDKVSVYINEELANPNRFVSSQDSPQISHEFRRSDANVCNNSTELLENKCLAAENRDSLYDSEENISSYHEENENHNFNKIGLKFNTDKLKKAEKLQNYQIKAERLNKTSENTSENKHNLTDKKCSDFTLTQNSNLTSSNYGHRLSEDKKTISTHLGFNDMWPHQNNSTQMKSNCYSSEIESDVASIEATDETNHLRQRFLGRSTPFPYEILRYETINSEEYDLIPTNIRRSHDSNSDSMMKQVSEEVYKNIPSTRFNVDIPESDSEVARLTLGAKTQTVDHYYFPSHVEDANERRHETLDRYYFPSNIQNDSNRNLNVHNRLALGQQGIQQPDTQQHSSEGENAITSISSSRVDSNSELSTVKFARNNPDLNQHNPYANVGHARTRIELPLGTDSVSSNFSFPLMLPSPSSFELSGPIRNHVRSYQRRSVFLASPYLSSRENSPLNCSSPHMALLESPMETSTPIICAKRTWDSFRCQTLSTPTLDNISQSLHLTMKGTNNRDSLSESKHINTLKTCSDKKEPPTTLPNSDITFSVAPDAYKQDGNTVLWDQTLPCPRQNLVHGGISVKQNHPHGRVLISPFN